MKVSKAGSMGYHTRTAVKVVSVHKGERARQKGILYRIPKTGYFISAEKLVAERLKAFQRLYKVFGPLDEKKDKDERPADAAKIAEAFDAVLFTFLKPREGSPRVPDAKTFRNAVANLRDERLQILTTSLNPASVDYVVDHLLRKSLRRPEAAEDLKTFMKTLCETDNLSGEVFFRELSRDYGGEKLSARAIRNLNLVIQPAGEGGDVRLAISGTGKKVTGSEFLEGVEKHEKGIYQHMEKQALREFLSNYATLDATLREDLRNRLRRIVILYFYGMEEVRKTNHPDFDAFHDHEERRANAERFVDDSALDEKGYVAGVRKLLHNVNAGSDGLYQKAFRELKENSGGLFFDDLVTNVFWLRRITKEVERITDHVSNYKKYKLEKGYLCEKVWKGLINYLSVKYVALGKAVYHFAMDDLDGSGNIIRTGRVNPAFSGGISSFELERIKAEETLQRETAVYVSFAARHLSGAAITLDRLPAGEQKAKSDVLSLSRGDFANATILRHSKKVRRDVLQFFGGLSSWNGFDFNGLEKNKAGEPEGTDFLWSVARCVFSLRNESFHFTTKAEGCDWNGDLIGNMFERDCQTAQLLERDKFYSNNLPMFYKQDDLLKVLNALYGRPSERASQVPSFNSVFARSSFSRILAEHGIRPVFGDQDGNLKFSSAVYYLYKEVYYCLFLQDDKARDYFLKAVTENANEAKNEKNEKWAARDFRTMISLVRELPLAQICQSVMTEYNQQNNQNRKKKTSREADLHPDKFRHYVDLLHECLRRAFLSYVKDKGDLLGFVKNPRTDCVMPSSEEFLPDYHADRLGYLAKAVKERKSLQKWYVTARLLAPKQANQFAGSLRSYRQYLEDIARRAAQEGNPILDRGGSPVTLEGGKVPLEGLVMPNYGEVLAILDLCTKLNGVITKEVSDYFDDEAEYARHLSKYLDFECPEGELNGEKVTGYLEAFCRTHSVNDGDVNQAIYHNGSNVILNRNVILAKLYGNAVSVERSLRKVTAETIGQYRQAQKEIREYQKAGYCKNEVEQKALKRFQELKNRIEFRDVVEYGEILNELQGQLVNWAYLRERDLTYFQLGFHYSCLNGAGKKPDGYATMETRDGKKICGAILYQVAALYAYGLPVYFQRNDGIFDCVDEEGKNSADCLTSEKLTKFFARYCRSGEGKDMGLSVYEAGLELFENVSEHDNVTDLRNYVDHFKYFSKCDRSMADLYGEMFDRFFTHDLKYQKNVVNAFNNILLSHVIIAREEFASGTKLVGRAGKKGSFTKDMASIRLRFLESEKYTYKLGDGIGRNAPTTEVHAKNREFLETVARMLTGRIENGSWRDEAEDIEIKERELKTKENDALKEKQNANPRSNQSVAKGKTNNKNGLSVKKATYDSDKSSSTSLTSTPFADFFKNQEKKGQGKR